MLTWAGEEYSNLKLDYLFRPTIIIITTNFIQYETNSELSHMFIFKFIYIIWI